MNRIAFFVVFLHFVVGFLDPKNVAQGDVANDVAIDVAIDVANDVAQGDVATDVANEFHRLMTFLCPPTFLAGFSLLLFPFSILPLWLANRARAHCCRCRCPTSLPWLASAFAVFCARHPGGEILKKNFFLKILK